MSVRCIVIVTAVILQLSDTVKCSNKVGNGDEKQIFVNLNNEFKTFPRTFTDDTPKDSKTRSFSEVSKLMKTDADFNHGHLRECRNSLCAFFKNHRVIRQAGYSPMYPQLPTNNTFNNHQYNTHQQINPYGNNNPYPSYSKPPIIPFQNPANTRPVYNSSVPRYPNNNISNSNYQNSRHTYPPSPRPPYVQPRPNNTANITSLRLPTNNSYPFNVNYPINSFGNVSKPGYPNSYPGSNSSNYNIYNNKDRTQNGYPSAPNNMYPQPRPLPSGQFINNSRPNYNGFNTYPTSNFNKNFNGYQSPNGPYKNGNSTYYNPQTNFTYGTPAVPNSSNYIGNNSYGSNKNNFQIPFGSNNYYPSNNNNAHANNFNQSLNNPYQWTSTNRPQTSYIPNVPQYNGAMEPNHFYYVPNNNSSHYDPRKHPPERFSY